MRADHRLQRVVHLVSDAGDQLADRRQPFASHEMLAHPQLFGLIADDRDDVHAAGAVDDRRRGPGGLKRAAVLALHDGRRADDLVFAQMVTKRRHLGA